MNGIAMPKNKLGPIDWEAAADAEAAGALAVSRYAKHRNAKMTKCGLTTAQLQVLKESASHLVHVLRRVKQPLHIGKIILELSARGKKEIVAISGL